MSLLNILLNIICIINKIILCSVINFKLVVYHDFYFLKILLNWFLCKREYYIFWAIKGISIFTYQPIENYS